MVGFVNEGRPVDFGPEGLRRVLDDWLDACAGNTCSAWSRNGFSWIHRWSRTKGLAPMGEPDPPPGVSAAYSAR